MKLERFKNLDFLHRKKWGKRNLILLSKIKSKFRIVQSVESEQQSQGDAVNKQPNFNQLVLMIFMVAPPVDL